MASSSVVLYGEQIYAKLKLAYQFEADPWFVKHEYWVRNFSGLNSFNYFLNYVLPILKRPHHPCHENIIFMWMSLRKARDEEERRHLQKYEVKRRKLCVKEKKKFVKTFDVLQLDDVECEDSVDNSYPEYNWNVSFGFFFKKEKIHFRRNVCKVNKFFSGNNGAVKRFVPLKLAQRSVMLHFKLRNWIARMRVGENVFKTSEIVPIAKCEMMSESDTVTGPTTPVIENQSNNTCIQDQTTPSETDIPPNSIPTSLGSNDNSHRYEDLLNRWIKYKDFTWTSEKIEGMEYSEPLPYNLVRDHSNQPNMIPFKLFQFWRGDIEIKAVLNSSPFMTGQLVLRWNYDEWMDSNTLLRDSVYSSIQMPHILLNAGSSNSGILKIAYKNPQPYLPTTFDESTRTQIPQDNVLCLGFVGVDILAPLRTPATVYKKATVTLFVKLTNSEFCGMRNASLGIQPTPPKLPGVCEMMPAITAAATETLLNFVSKQVKTDKPPYTEARLPVSPQAMQNITAVSNHSYVTNALRFDPTALTPIPHKVVDEMSVLSVAKKFGLVDIITWSTSSATENIIGYKLKSYDASPLWQFSNYPKIELGVDKISGYHLPPVAVVSSMYAYWRGCLDMRLDFVANRFYRGKILVAYVPGWFKNANVDMEKAMGSYHMTYDLAEEQTVTFTIPYITNKYAFPRRIGFDSISSGQTAPGRVYIFVLNPLVPMDNVNPEIQINVYWAASDDFEVMVPSQPVIGLPFWEPADQSKIVIPNDYRPFYIGSWRNLKNNTKGILRYGWAWDDIVIVTGLKVEFVYKSQSPINYVGTDGGAQSAELFVGVDIDDGMGMIYLSPIKEDNVRKYCLPFQKDGKTKNPFYLDQTLLIDVKPSDDSAPFAATDIAFDEGTKPKWQVADEGFEILSKPEMFRSTSFDVRQERENACQLLPCIRRNIDKTIFGEDFTSLKDLTKRQQPYCLLSLTTTNVPGDATYLVPLYPQGLKLDPYTDASKSVTVTTAIRDGHIPIIMSGFQFWRGGMDLTIIVKRKKTVNDCNVWIQHRPDYYPKHQRPTKVVTDKDIDAENFFNHSYAFQILSAAVNNVLHVSIPYYQPYAYSFACNPNIKSDDARSMCSNGCLAIGVEGSKDDDIQLQILYSLSDEAVFEFFRGFPPMRPLPGYVEPSASCEGVFDDIKKISSDGVGVDVQSTSLDNLSTKIGEGITLKHECDSLKVMTESIQKLTDKGIDLKLDIKSGQTNDVVETVSTKLKECFGQSLDLGTDVIFAVGTVFMNPSLKTAAWAIGFVFLKSKLLTPSLFTKFIACIEGLFKKWDIKLFNSNNEPEQPVSMGSRVAMPEMDGDEIMSIFDVMFTAVSQVVNITVKKPKNILSFTKVLVEGLGNSFRTGNFFFVFLKNNMKLFKKIFLYYQNWQNKDKMLEQLVENDLVAVTEWCEEVDVLLDPSNEEKIFARDSRWAHRMEIAYVLGCKLNRLFLDYKNSKYNSTSMYQSFSNLYKRLCIQRGNMYKRGNSGIARREPFAIYLSGAPGIGKSQVSHSFASDLVKHAGIQYEGECVFTLQSGSAYWNGCRNQPCIFMDDFLNITDGEVKNNTVQSFWQIKSPMTLNPPQAALEDKEARYCPELLIVSANEAFPFVNNINLDALYRRRDVLLACELKPMFKEAGILKITSANDSDFKDLCKKNNIDCSKFQHLDFYIFDDTSNPSSKKTGPYNYSLIMSKLSARFTNYRTNQMKLYEIHIKKYEENMLADYDEPTSLSDKKEQLKRMCDFLMKFDPVTTDNFSNYMKVAKLHADGHVVSSELMKSVKEVHSLCKDRTKPEMNPDCPLCVYMEANKDYFKDFKFTHRCYTRDFGKIKFREILVVPQYECKHGDICADADFEDEHYKNILENGTEKIKYEICNEKCWLYDNICAFIFGFWQLQYCELNTWKSVAKETVPPTVKMVHPREFQYTVVKPHLKAESKVEISKGFMEKLSNFYSWISDLAVKFYERYMKPTFKFIWKVFKIAFPLFSLALIGVTVYGMCTGNPLLAYSSLFGASASFAGNDAMNLIENEGNPTFHVKCQPELQTSGDMKTTKSNQNSAKPAYTVFSKIESHEEKFEFLIKLIKNNTYYVQAKLDSGSYGKKNRFIMIGSNYGIMPKHYIISYKQSHIENLRVGHYSRRNEYFEFSLEDLKYTFSEDTDMALVRIPHIPAVKNLVKHFASEQEHKRSHYRGKFVEVLDESVLLTDIIIQDNANTIVDMYGDQVHMKNLYKYEYHGLGKCGSLILDLSNNRSILGMHVAGNGRDGFSVPLVKEGFPVFGDVGGNPGVVQVEIENSRLDGQFRAIGMTDTGLGHFQSGETQIGPSLIHGVFPVISEPAPIKTGDPRVEWAGPGKYSPLYSGVSNMMKPTKQFNSKHLKLAAENLERKILANCIPVRRLSVLSWNDSIVGIPGEKYYDGLDMNTSEGFPFSRYRPPNYVNKTWLFKLEKQQDSTFKCVGIDKVLVDVMINKNIQRLQEIVPMTVFDDCLKDERKPTEKIKIPGKTRVFSTSPVDYTIQFKQFLSDFQASFKTHRLKLNHAIGINPDSPEWTQILENLHEVDGRNYITGDYSNFGPSLNSEVLEKAIDVIVKWYEFYWRAHHNSNLPRTNRLIIRSLLMESRNSYHCTRDFIWQSLSGIPSGSPVTVELNTEVNDLYLQTAWCEIMALTIYASLEYFNKFVRYFTYGDDLIMNVADCVKDYFNNVSLSKYFAKLGIKFTDASKTGNIAYTNNLKDVTFLKRGFLSHPLFNNYYLAPLDENYSVKEVANWVHKKNNPLAATVDSISGCNNNAYSLGPKKFHQIHSVLKEKLIEVGSDYRLRTWDELDRIHFSSMYVS